MSFRLALLVIFTVVSVGSLSAQPARIDSLSRIVDFLPDDSLKAHALRELTYFFIFSDSDKAKKYIAAAERICQARKLTYSSVDILRLKGIYYDVTGLRDSGYYYFKKGYEMSQDYGYTDLAVKNLNGLGMNAWNSGRRGDALAYFLEVLEKNRTLDPAIRISESVPYTNIGLIHQEQGQYEKALEFHYKALDLRLADPALVMHIATSYNNIGICLAHLQRLDDADSVYREGIRLAKKTGHKRQYYDLISNLANTLTLKSEYDEALALNLEILRSDSRLSLAPQFLMNINAKVAGIYLQKNQPRKALTYVTEGLRLIDLHPEIEFYSADLQRTASVTYYLLGDSQKGLEHNNRMQDVLENKFSKEAAKATADLEVKYETARKENEILRLQAEREEANLKMALAEIEQNRKDRILYAVIGLALLVTAALLALHRWRQLKWRHEEEQKIHNAIFLSEQNERVRIARDLHDSIGQKLAVQRMILSQLKEVSPEAASDIRKASELLDETVREVRTISHNLIPQELTLGLLKAITETAERINQAGEVHVEVDCRTDATGNVPQNHQLSIYRIFQEILNNMLKHAGATKINISITEFDDQLELLIKDNGRGMTEENVQQSRGIGWKNVVARTRLVSGSLRIDSNTQQGTCIKLLVPITTS